MGSTERTKRRKEKLISKVMSVQQKHPNLPNHQSILIDADEDILREMTEDQWETYRYGAQMLAEQPTNIAQEDIQQYIPRKEKSELDPGEKRKQQPG
jgi:hypothetical protein